VERGRPKTFALAALVTFVPLVAHAGPREDDAATAYDRGAKAYDRGDFAAAASELARADELAPNGVALELALAAVVKTDDAVLAMTLAERADARKPTKALDSASHAARRRFGTRVGRLNVVCPPPAACTALVDATPFVTGTTSFVLVGPHRVVIVRESSTEEHPVVIEAGKTVQLVATVAQPQAAPVAPLPPPGSASPARQVERPLASSGGIAPGWFWFGAAVTAALGGASVLSGLDTVKKHDAFVADRSNAASADAGRASDRRTTVLLLATGGAAVTTTALGIFFVRWRDDATIRASLAGPTVLVRAEF
jgi:hypothetical protein